MLSSRPGLPEPVESVRRSLGQLVHSPPEAGVLAAHLLPLFTWVLYLQYRVFNFEGS
jgi:hypothetical protein